MGKDGLIFSNRFEQPDIDELLKEMEQKGVVMVKGKGRGTKYIIK